MVIGCCESSEGAISRATLNATKKTPNPWDYVHHPIVKGELPMSNPISSGVASGVPTPKTTGVVVIETPKQGVTPQQIMAVIPEEIRATVKLYLDGKIREWYSRGDGKGVIFLVDAKTEDEARALMEALPLA